MSEFTMAISGLVQLLGMAEGAGGGVWPGLLAQFEAAGFGAHVESWRGAEEKRPITPDELSTVLTPQQLQEWSDKAGTTPDVLLHRLAEALPHALAGPAGTLPG